MNFENGDFFIGDRNCRCDSFSCGDSEERILSFCKVSIEFKFEVPFSSSINFSLDFSYFTSFSEYLNFIGSLFGFISAFAASFELFSRTTLSFERD